ncbi:hypothetical protein C369_07265 [Cryptococcus neoformans A5-35-17]|nr:hypothetical protein C369_07265 [Cryptococcus neoformans var. grubii A5-35-17]
MFRKGMRQASYILTPDGMSLNQYIDLISETVETCAISLAAYQGHQANIRPPPSAAPPRPVVAPAYQNHPVPIKALLTGPEPAPPSAGEVQEWLNCSLRLPSRQDGLRARDYLRQQGLCFGCRQQGHMVAAYPAYASQPVASLSSAPVHAPAPVPEPSNMPPAQESVPLLHIQARRSTDGLSYQTLVDSGAAVNVVDKELVEELGLETQRMLPIVTKMADESIGPQITQKIFMDIHVGSIIYCNSPFVVMPLGHSNRLILGLPFHLQH